MRLLLSVTALLLVGCTTVGLHDPSARRQIDFGPPDTVALCLYLDDGISEATGRSLIRDAWRQDAPLYGLDVTVVTVRPWRRPAFTVNGILDGVVREPLTPQCDRVMALVSRTIGDFLWGLLPLPEVLGAVDDETLTHGYAVARWATVNQLVISPRAATRHEIYHMLGCDEHFNMQSCYERIAALKRWKRTHNSDFFPAWDSIHKRLITSRAEVNARLAGTDAQTSRNSGERTSVP